MGTEVAIAADWTAKLEYLYYHFGDVDGTFPSGTSYKSSFDLQTVRLGLNRQLDWGNPGSVGSWTSDPQLLASGNWNVHGQLTFIGQGYGQFHSPYFSDNSLFGGSQYKNTTSATAFIGYAPMGRHRNLRQSRVDAGQRSRATRSALAAFPMAKRKSRASRYRA